jgi:hypothetical protein
MCHLSKCSYIFIPYHKNGGEIHNIKRANKFLQNVTEFGYLETLVTIKIAFTQKEGAVWMLKPGTFRKKKSLALPAAPPIRWKCDLIHVPSDCSRRHKIGSFKVTTKSYSVATQTAEPRRVKTAQNSHRSKVRNAVVVTYSRAVKRERGEFLPWPEACDFVTAAIISVLHFELVTNLLISEYHANSTISNTVFIWNRKKMTAILNNCCAEFCIFFVTPPSLSLSLLAYEL